MAINQYHQQPNNSKNVVLSTGTMTKSATMCSRTETIQIVNNYKPNIDGTQKTKLSLNNNDILLPTLLLLLLLTNAVAAAVLLLLLLLLLLVSMLLLLL